MKAFTKKRQKYWSKEAKEKKFRKKLLEIKEEKLKVNDYFLYLEENPELEEKREEYLEKREEVREEKLRMK